MHGIADYEFVAKLGSGNHGQAFLAHRPPRLPGPARYVAVKVLYTESTADTFRRATRALRAVASVRSPYLADLYDAGQHDGVFYYAMEYCPGGSLSAPIAAVDQYAALRAVANAASAVGALHAAGLVHAAVTPGNVLLAGRGAEGGGPAKLADPGLSEVFTPGATLTGAGSVTTIEYADPDLLRGAPAAPYHDVWSLGVLLHQVAASCGLYGELPSTDGVQVVRQLLSVRPRVSPTLPQPLAGLVRDCLAAPGSRPAAAEVAERISAAAG